MFNYGQPFTHSGMLTTLHLTKNINVYNGAVNGWDRQFDMQVYLELHRRLQRHVQERQDLAGHDLHLRAPTSSRPSCPLSQNPIYPTGSIPPPPQFAGKTNPGYNSNDRGLFTTVLTHKWSDKLTQVMETDQAWETNVPFALGNTDGFNRHNAQWYSFGNWFLYSFNDKLTGVWRSEIFRDNNGVRTGTAGDYNEFTLGGDLQAQALPLDPPGSPVRLHQRGQGLQRQHPEQPVDARLRHHPALLSRSSTPVLRTSSSHSPEGRPAILPSRGLAGRSGPGPTRWASCATRRVGPWRTARAGRYNYVLK